MAKSVNKEILDRIITRSIFTQRFSNHEVQQIISILNASIPELIDVLMRRVARAEAHSGVPAREDTRRIRDLIESLQDIVDAASAGMLTNLSSTLLAFSEQEVASLLRSVQSASPIQLGLNSLSPDLLRGIIKRQQIQGAPLNQWFKGLTQSTTQQIVRQVNIGMVQGEGVSAIVRRVQGTRSLGFTDGLMGKTRNHVEALVRTSITQTANQVREQVALANTDVIKGFRFIAVLDTRTTILCASLDGKYWDVGDPKMKRPPLHWNCRSSLAPVTKSWKELKLPGIKELGPTTRASMDGQVPSTLTYPEWLSQQSVERVDKVLGRRRSQLFRSGQYDLDEFINDKGDVLTLEQLAKISD